MFKIILNITVKCVLHCFLCTENVNINLTGAIQMFTDTGM